jgi:hypothetical protein
MPDIYTTNWPPANGRLARFFQFEVLWWGHATRAPSLPKMARGPPGHLEPRSGGFSGEARVASTGLFFPIVATRAKIA